MMNDEGNFIVRNGDFLRLYSPDFKVLRERKLEGVKKYDYWELRLSPTGRTLLLKHYIPSNTHIEILRSSSLSPLGSGLDRALSFRFAISDDSLATAEESTRVLLRKVCRTVASHLGGEESSMSIYAGICNEYRIAHSLLV